jgi:hypothetical protein
MAINIITAKAMPFASGWPKTKGDYIAFIDAGMEIDQMASLWP